MEGIKNMVLLIPSVPLSGCKRCDTVPVTCRAMPTNAAESDHEQ